MFLVVGRVNVDRGVARERRIVIAFIAKEYLARGGDEIGAVLPLRRLPVFEAGLEAAQRDAGDGVALRHLHADGIVGIEGRPGNRPGLPQLKAAGEGLFGDGMMKFDWKVASTSAYLA